MQTLSTTLVLLALGLGQLAQADTFNPAGPSPSSIPGVHGAARTAPPVLLVRDYVPWNGDIVPFFTAAGASVTVVTTSQLPTVNLADYCLVAITTGLCASGDPTETNVNASVGLLSSHVVAGGTVLYQTGTVGANLQLPGGVWTSGYGDLDNWFTGPHPIAAGMPYPQFSGSAASHDLLNNLPGSASVITVNSTGQATGAEYTLGAGTVLAFTQPTECYIPVGYCYGIYPHFNQFQTNVISYAMAVAGCDNGGQVGADELPAAFALLGNHPNPFNPVTSISFSLAETTPITLSVFDLGGSLVARLVDGVTERGQHSVTFDAGNLPSGLYVTRLEALGQAQSRRMLLVK